MAIPEEIIVKLMRVFENDADSFARASFFLAKCVENGREAPYIRSLQRVLSDTILFKKVAQRMLEDTKNADDDPLYQQMMYDVWNNFLKDSLTERPGGGQKYALAVRQDGAFSVGQFCFMRAVSRLPPESFRALASGVNSFGRQLAIYGGRALSYAQKANTLVRVPLVAVYLAWDVIKNIKRWWKGEITGKRCAKNIIDCGVAIAGGVGVGIGGEIIGASVGLIFGPLGMAIGAIVGAVAGGALGAITAETLCDRLTQWMFGLPKSEALENAYNFLKISPNASNSVVNSQYRRLALTYHPDKGGDAEKWTRLQYSMAVIREARGEP